VAADVLLRRAALVGAGFLVATARVAFVFVFAVTFVLGLVFDVVRVLDLDFDFATLDVFATDLSSHQIEPTVNAAAASALR
jgi:hypothetical protein